MYASSKTTRHGSSKSSSISSRLITEPSGLFGEVNIKSFALFFKTASFIDLTSIPKLGAGFRGTFTVTPSKKRNNKSQRKHIFTHTINAAIEFIHPKRWRCINEDILRFKNSSQDQVDKLFMEDEDSKY